MNFLIDLHIEDYCQVQNRKFLLLLCWIKVLEAKDNSTVDLNLEKPFRFLYQAISYYNVTVSFVQLNTISMDKRVSNDQQIGYYDFIRQIQRGFQFSFMHVCWWLCALHRMSFNKIVSLKTKRGLFVC